MANKSKVTLEDKVVDLSLLKEHPDNPNIHPIDQIEALAKSMETYGQYYRIIVDEDYTILAGHGKKMALEHKGEKTANVTVMHGLSAKQKKKLLIEDNKIQSLSYVNYGKIEDIIKEIGEVDIIGFPANYIDAIINEVSVDNMGVDFATAPVKEKAYTEEKQDVQASEFSSIEEGMQQASVFRCPHCGKEIAM